MRLTGCPLPDKPVTLDLIVRDEGGQRVLKISFGLKHPSEHLDVVPHVMSGLLAGGDEFVFEYEPIEAAVV